MPTEPAGAQSQLNTPSQFQGLKRGDIVTQKMGRGAVPYVVRSDSEDSDDGHELQIKTHAVSTIEPNSVGPEILPGDHPFVRPHFLDDPNRLMIDYLETYQLRNSFAFSDPISTNPYHERIPISVKYSPFEYPLSSIREDPLHPPGLPPVAQSPFPVDPVQQAANDSILAAHQRAWQDAPTFTPQPPSDVPNLPNDSVFTRICTTLTNLCRHRDTGRAPGAQETINVVTSHIPKQLRNLPPDEIDQSSKDYWRTQSQDGTKRTAELVSNALHTPNMLRLRVP